MTMRFPHPSVFPAAALLLSATLLVAEPGEAVAHLEFAKKVEMPAPALEKGRVLAIRLDSDVCERTRERFPDLRVVAGETGDEIPFALRQLRRPKIVTRSERHPSRLESLGKMEGNQVEFVVRLILKENDPVPSIHRLVLRTPGRDFEKRVTVLGSNDQTDWTPLVQDVPIYDYSSIADIANRTIPLPLPAEATFRYFKVIISNFQETKSAAVRELIRETRDGKKVSEIEKSLEDTSPLRVEDIEVWIRHERTVEDETVTVPVPVKIIGTTTAEGRTTLDIQTRRDPLVSLRLQTDSVNFARNATLLAGDDPDSLRRIAETNLTRISLGDQFSESLSISFPETRAAQFRIVIENGNAPGLNITGAEAEANVYTAEMISDHLPEKGGIRMAYGGNEVSAPSYDIAAILQGKPGTNFLECSLGTEEPNPFYGKAQPASFWERLLGGKTPLRIAVVGMCIVLAAILFWSLKKAQPQIEE
jgi:hypothetical protein